MEKNRFSGNFIGSFKIGDNIIYNLNSLNILYSLYQKIKEEDKPFLLKPMITQIAFIIEAVLYDFRGRARSHTREKSLNIEQNLISTFQEKTNDQFNFLIDQARKHKIFNDDTNLICEKLNKLRLVRNRVHIQNKENQFPRDEFDVFTLDTLKEAEFLLKYILQYMVENHPRPKGAHFGEDFILPFS
jgi:hypothetical protein